MSSAAGPDAVQSAVMSEQFAIGCIGLGAGVIAFAMPGGVHWSRVKAPVRKQRLSVFFKVYLPRGMSPYGYQNTRRAN